jgi:hypothetical protein
MGEVHAWTNMMDTSVGPWDTIVVKNSEFLLADFIWKLVLILKEVWPIGTKDTNSANGRRVVKAYIEL